MDLCKVGPFTCVHAQLIVLCVYVAVGVGGRGIELIIFFSGPEHSLNLAITVRLCSISSVSNCQSINPLQQMF